jgi:EAL domain-containing protein (putative c-di-GMP-specific phosphodiesterase class I)
MILHCDPDYLKVDRGLVAGCHRDRRRLALLESLCGLAARLPARVVAEGVEDRADLEALRLLGVELAQGFLLAPPAAAGRLSASSPMVNE